MQFDQTQHNIALVVDDSPATLGFVSTALEEIGMTVLIARDGQAAIELVRRVQPDVIMMDVMMPEMDGFETCARLKNAPMAVDAPIIFMTGLTDRENIIKGLQSGGVDYITKPVQIDEMIARVTVHMLNSKMVRSAREALDSSGRSVLALDEDGQVAWGSPRALQLLEQTGLESMQISGAPAAIQTWLADVSTKPVSQSCAFEGLGVRLSYVGRSSTNELLVRLSVLSREHAPDVLAREFSLTAREGEVLYWLAQGKTNRDIAEILSLSARTVNKHLEQVFQKLGVDNRTSAAVQADRTLSLKV